MLIVCPSCKTKFSYDDKKVGADGVKLRCSKCRTIFRVVRKGPPPPAPMEAPKPSVAPAAGRIKVVVANESPAFCTAVQKVLAAEPFDVFVCNDGKIALATVEQQLPDVVLLDVALPSMYGFEVCDAIRKNPAIAATKLILIASIYDKTRYKRAPNSLYGADEYIEKHHIPDSLAALIYKLVSGQETLEAPAAKTPPAEEEGQTAVDCPTGRELAAQEAVREELKRDEEQETLVAQAPLVTELPEAHLKAKRLARIIVSDIVLYNQSKVEEGVRNGRLLELLADDIREGRALYERRVPEEIRKEASYLEEAFEELMAN